MILLALGATASGCAGGEDVAGDTVANQDPVQGAVEPPDEANGVVSVDGELNDTTRDRRIPYRVFAPVGVSGSVPVVVVSHGGQGNPRGHLGANHFGQALAGAGYVAVHLAHLPVEPTGRNVVLRPGDVSAALDALADGTMALPEGTGVVPDVSRAGHLGHSYGAYTANAVAGATFEFGGERRTFTDPRVQAIVALSPQGADQIGAFDDGNGGTSWSTVRIPTYSIIGELEMDLRVGGGEPARMAPNWRLQPFRNYPDTADHIASILAGLGHSDLWNTGGGAVQTWLAAEAVRFFDAYLARYPDADACAVGEGAVDGVGVVTERRPAASGSLLTGCT